MTASDHDLLETAHDEGGGRSDEQADGLLRIDRYIVLDRLGAGGMGTVFLARDPDLDRNIAIKLLRGGASGLSQARMLREAQAMAQLSHPNVAAIYDVGRFGQQVFMAMEYVAGGTLRDWLADGPRPWAEVLPIFIAAGRGLAAAHAVGLIHRDFKPANVLLSLDDVPKVTDFGLVRSERARGLAAREADATTETDLEAEPRPDPDTPAAASAPSRAPTTAEPRAAASSSHGSLSGEIVLGAQASVSASSSGSASSSSNAFDLQLTTQGSSVGTPAYMSPEQILGDDIDARSDQFSFCVALHEALWGVSPFAGDDTKSRLRNVLEDARQPQPDDRDVPDWLAAIVERGLSPEPRARWPSMAELLAALADDPAARRKTWRRRLLAVGLCSTTLAAFLAHTQLQAARCEQAADAAHRVWAPYAAAIEDAVRAGGPAYAEANTQRVRAGVDDWLGRWAEARGQLCRADDLERSEQARRERCLTEQLDAFSALLEVIGERAESPGVAAHAIAAVAALPEPALCEDPRIDPLDGETRGCTPALAVAVHRLRALELAGLHAEGVTAGAALLDTPGLATCSSVEAQALLTTGRLELALGHGEDANAKLQRALQLANAHEDLATARAAALALARAAGRQARFEVALVWVEVAELFGQRLGARPVEVVDERLTRVELLNAADRDDEARAVLEQAHALIEETLGEQHPSFLRYLESAASLEAATPASARALLEQALAMARALYGPEHPETISVMLRLIPVQDTSAARLAMARETLAKAEAANGSAHPQTLAARDTVAVHLLLSGEYDAASERFPGIIADHERLDPPAPLAHARALAHYGVALRRQSELERAEQTLRAAIALIDAELGPEHPEGTNTLINLANVVEERGRISEAVALLRQAREILARRQPNSQGLAVLLDNLGKLELELGDAPSALRNIERAATIGRARHQAGDLRMIDYLTDLALAEAANGQRDRARARFEALMHTCETHDDPSNDECIYTRGIFAEFLLGEPGQTPREDLQRALALSEQARAESASLGSRSDAAYLRFVHARVLARAGQTKRAEEIASALLEELTPLVERRRDRALRDAIAAWLRRR
ncbi:serine/threonine protein kinase [Pseudenhygromyxa sp. WMMC2535]|uniref:serine/threonine-protein kinase n=1 Tax=Pseudenhygromyxa sp. WMMC2535 TaxID=2712867 RepID=UPI001556594A|nr:serine/threonine-protein kinase [Pseudenhygromyxa sp. WMMC2535]NVB40948.1 serine/threonine protein kinase [Pseudenhygromyxa sp. WMMC2535]